MSWTTSVQPGNGASTCRAQGQATIQPCQRTGPDGGPSLAAGTHISVYKLPSPSAGTAVSLPRAKMVQQRTPLPRENKTWPPDCGVAHQVGTDHLSRLPVMPPLTFDVSSLQVQPQRLRGCQSEMVGWGYQSGLANCRVWWFSPPACQWQPSFVGLAVQCWRALEAMGFAARLGFFYKKNALYKFTVIIIVGVERWVPEMRCIVEFNCTSTWLVWAERDQTGAQHSAAE